MYRPSRGFRVGSMRERIQIQTASESTDSAGQVIRTWSTTYANEPADRIPVRGGETIRGRQVEAGIDEIFIIRHRDNLDTTLRVTHGGNTYGIVYVNPIDGGRRYIELHCKANP